MLTGEQTIERLLADMTPAEKIGQMTQASNEAITPAEVAEFGIGSVLSGGNGNPTPNTPEAWVDMVGSFVEAAAETRAGIPLLYGVDAVHGHSNVRGATVFPHNIGLGATGDPDLVRRIGGATAAEMLATEVHWTFAPVLAVPHDIRWGRTYEGYGNDPELVSKLGAALIQGLQGSDQDRISVLACAKHYVGDGATTWGTAPRLDWVDWWHGWGDAWQIDQGDAPIPEAELRAVHLPPYTAAVDAGVMTVMASYNSWNGEKLHGHRYLLTDVLKGELGFEGMVVSDWMGIDQVAADYEDAAVTAINAGIDMVMVPENFRRFIDVMHRATSSGRVPMSRIDEAVRRILRAKQAAGLFEPSVERPPIGVIGSREHRALAAEAVRKGAVLLKNESAIPISSGYPVVHVAGPAADDVGLQCGGWTVGWQGEPGPITDGSTLLDGLRTMFSGPVVYDPSGGFPQRSAIGVVCIAEPPYAEGPGDRAEPTASDDDRATFARMRERCDTLILVIYSGRPLIIPDLIEQADAVVAAWLPGSEGAVLGELLAGRHRFQGKTPQPWPASAAALDERQTKPLFPLGAGTGSSPTGDQQAGRR